MILPTVLAALAALPAISAQYTSVSYDTATRCTTRYGFNPLPTGTAGVPTWYSTTTTTSVFEQTVTTRDTVTVTPSATTFTEIESTTTVITTTETTTPPAITQPTPYQFLPLLNIGSAIQTPSPTGGSRIMRAVEGRNGVVHPFKRQTPAGNTGGFMAYPNGTYSSIYCRYPHRIDCNVTVTEFDTVINVVTGTPETATAPQSTATAESTVTISSTTTITEVAPAPTIYEACESNNVVNHVSDIDGNTMYFDRIIYQPENGFPIANELVVNTTSPENCCIACQNTPYCAGSFYAPGDSECHIRLTQPFTPYPPGLPGNASASATATGAVAPIATGTPGNGTCSAGSLSLYNGIIMGQPSFPEDLAVYVSNGPCGRFSVSPIPPPFEEPGPVKRGLAIAAK